MIQAQKFRDAIKEALQDAIMNDDAVWNAFEEMLQDELEKSHCRIEFGGGVPEVLIATLDDIVMTFKHDKLEISVEDYARLQPSAAQLEDIREQLAGIDRLAKMLNIARDKLQRRL